MNCWRGLLGWRGVEGGELARGLEQRFCEHSSEAWFFQRWNREPVAVVVVVVVVVACLRNLKFFESSQSLRSPSLICFPCCFQTPFERPPSFKTPPPSSTLGLQGSSNFPHRDLQRFQVPRLVAKVAQPKN
jgi:hypothetical protein